MTRMLVSDVVAALEARRDRSAWDRGVTRYALDMLEGLEVEELFPRTVEKALLNGAPSWRDYSWGGCALIYDRDIAERLCCPSELRRTRGGERRPNAREEWLDTQARACFQACMRIKRIVSRGQEG